MSVPKMKIFADEMKEGKWRVTGAPIVRDWDLRLVDGQHRLKDVGQGVREEVGQDVREEVCRG